MSPSPQQESLLNNIEYHEKVILRKDVQEAVKPIKTHPDGGWGWVVVAAAFITQFVIVGLQNSSGVVFNELVERFNSSRGETGFVSSISCGMMFILGPITTTLCQKFGCRTISILGGLLCILGMVASAYANTLQVMYITFGFTWGLGTSFCYFPTLIILVPYFDKKLALVNGIVSSGSGIGTLILSPFLSWFSHEYGVKKMFFMLAALHSLVFFAGFVYRPISDHYKLLQGRKIKSKKNPKKTSESLLKADSGTQLLQQNGSIITGDESIEEKKKKKRFQNLVLLSLFDDKAFIAWCLGLSVFMLGYFVPFVHLVRYAKLIGISEVKAAFLISTLSITATIFKVITGKVAGMKHVDTFKMYQIALLIMGVATTLIPVSTSYIGLVFYSVVFGISESAFIVMIPIITKDIVGVRRLPLALGVVFMLMGIPTVVGAPIAGWIYDAFGDYSYAFYVAGSMNTFGVLVMFFVTLFRESEITMVEKLIITEDNEERPSSKIIEFSCYASSERIYYSQSDLLELDACFHNNNLEIRLSNTSLFQGNRYVKCESDRSISPLVDSEITLNKSSSRLLSPSSAAYRPESPSISMVQNNKKKVERNNLKLWAHLMHENRKREESKGNNRYSFCSLDSTYYVVDSVVTTV